ncbi:hypothetical protein B0H11DRAFT_1934809 [Mycena galericulata]|nr:hypothetical protein B0H11DRAFT_1934809 [Mycena galericulata]
MFATPKVANRHTSGAEEQDLQPGVLKLPGAETNAADPAWYFTTATISHHSQLSHRDPVAGEFSGETTPQQIANLRGEISQLRGQLESLQVTLETLSKNMVTVSMFHAGPSLNTMTPPEPPEGKRVLIKETTPPTKINSASEDDAVPPPEPVRTEVVKEVPTPRGSEDKRLPYGVGGRVSGRPPKKKLYQPMYVLVLRGPIWDTSQDIPEQLTSKT